MAGCGNVDSKVSPQPVTADESLPNGRIALIMANRDEQATSVTRPSSQRKSGLVTVAGQARVQALDCRAPKSRDSGYPEITL